MKNNQHLTLKKPKTGMAALALGAVSLALGAALINIATPNIVSAAEEMAEVYLGASNLTFEPYEDFEKAYLRISGPEGYRTLKAFESGEAMTVDLLAPNQFGPADGEPGWNAPLKAHIDLAKGRYRYEVVYTFAGGRTQTQSGSFFVNDGFAYQSPHAAGLSIPPRNEGLPHGNGGKSSGDKAGLKQDFDDLVQILDNQGDDLTQLFWGNTSFANWRLDNRSGDLTWERFDAGGENRMILEAEGSLGLGTTAPSDDLHIVSTDGTPAIKIEDPTGEENWQMVSGGASTLQFDYEGTLGSENDILTIAHTGNVGVGTGLNPSAPLHVQRSDGSAGLLIRETNSTAAARELFKLSNNGGPFFIFENTDISQSYSFAMGATGHFLLSHQQTSGVQLRLRPSGDMTIAGTLTEGSSREIKSNITPLDERTVLAKLDNLPVSEWTYKADQTKRHIGPMAEDFYATFGLGPDNKHIAPRDLAGVALAAAKALKKENESLKSENQDLRARLERIESRLGLSKE